MTRDDDPTQPLPAAPDQSTVPIDGAPTEPIVAPHVPIADVQTAELSAYAPDAPGRSRGASVVLTVVVGIAAAAFVGAILATIFTRGGVPVPGPSSSMTPSPGVTVAIDPDADPASPSDQPDPPAVEPTPEPTATDVPTPDPTPEPTPSQTP
jgi:hypothetical protein